MQTSKTFLAAAAFALLGGCAGANGPAELEFGPMLGATNEGIAVVIENETPSSVRAYAVAHGDEIPLGRVTALGSRTVRVPLSWGQFQLMVRPSALDAPGRHHLSELIQAMPGQRVRWQLQASPGTSQLPRMSVVQVFACRSPAEC